MKQILINCEELQTRVAVVQDGILQDFFMERNIRDTMVGSIYKGRIKNLEPSLQAAFVDIGCGKNAFLHYWDMIPASEETLETSDDDGEGEGDGEISGNDESDDDDNLNPPTRAQNNPNPNQNPIPNQPSQRSSNRRRRRPRKNPQQQGADQQPKVAESSSPLKGLLAKVREIFSPGKKKTAPAAAGVLAPAPRGGQQQRQPQAPRKARSDGDSVAPVGDDDRDRKSDQSRNRHRPSRRPPKTGPAVEDIPNLFKVDQEILVQVTKGPIGTKGARVTTNLSIPGRYLVLLPNSSHIGISKRVEERDERDRLRQMIRGLKLPKNMGLICRTVGAGRKQEHFQRDLDLLLDYWHKGEQIAATHRAPVCVYQEPDLAERALRDCLTEDVDEVVVDSEETYQRATELIKRYNKQDSTRVKFYQNPTPIFHSFGLTQQLDGVFNRKVPLPSGGYLCIDETEALIAIDVNTGKNRSGKDQPETILATNLEAVKEIARQLRLRNLGGIIVLDLIDMRQKKDQQVVFKTFKDLLAEDRARTKIYQLSPLGLLEMTRQREHESMESAIFDNCPYCKGSGLVKSTTSMSVDIQRRLNEILGRRKPGQKLKVAVHPRVADRLNNNDRKLVDGLKQEYSCEISFHSDQSLHIEEFHISDAVSGQNV
ncbi:MAG TPA: Rne/Rng family ribonuclease [Lentisphaeria bacterium]|nr:Rne/Rng family ribonuclease [Lentisphaeria bacterium]